MDDDNNNKNKTIKFLTFSFTFLAPYVRIFNFSLKIHNLGLVA